MTARTTRISFADSSRLLCGFGLLLNALMLVATLSSSLSASATEIYTYENRLGEKLFSDRPLDRSGYRLVKRQGAGGYSTEPTPKSRPVGLSKNLAPFNERAKKFDDYIAWAARSYELDPALIKAVIHAESAFDPNATSHAGAQGLMQLMPATARSHGVRDSYNPHQNIMGGSRHLRYLMDKYNNNITLAVAAYNAGEVPVNKYKGVPPYEETQKYVKKVIKLQKKYAETENLYASLQ